MTSSKCTLLLRSLAGWTAVHWMAPLAGGQVEVSLRPVFCDASPVQGYPELRVGSSLSQVTKWALGPGGHVAAAVRLTGDGVDTSNDDAIVRAGPDGAIHLILREGDPLPIAGVTQTVRYSRLAAPLVIDRTGRVGILAAVTGLPGRSSYNSVVIAGTPNRVEVVRYEGEQVENSFGEAQIVSDFNNIALSRSGVLVLSEKWQAPASAAATRAVAWDGLGFHVVIQGDYDFVTTFREGWVAGGASFIASDGNVAWHGNWHELIFDFVNVYSRIGYEPYARRLSTGWTRVASTWDAAPGIPDLRLVGSPRYQSFASNGWAAYTCQLEGDGVTTADDRALWIAGPPGKWLVAREGSGLPGVTGSITDLSNPEVAVSSTGLAVLRATVESGDTGVWVWDNGDLAPLALTGGGGVPGFEGESWEDLASAGINPNGRIFLVGSQSGDAGRLGIWGTDHNGELHPVVQPGAVLELSDGSTVTASSPVVLDFGQALREVPNGDDGTNANFNERDEILMRFASGCVAVARLFRPGLDWRAFRDWVAGRFEASQRADKAISGFWSDPDDDGMINGLECLLGGSPLEPDGPTLVRSGRLGDTSLPGLFVEARLNDDLSGVRVVVQVSRDLTTWMEIYDVTEGVVLSDVYEVDRDVEDGRTRIRVVSSGGGDDRAPIGHLRFALSGAIDGD